MSMFTRIRRYLNGGLERQQNRGLLKKEEGVTFERGIQKGSILCLARGDAMVDNQ